MAEKRPPNGYPLPGPVDTTADKIMNSVFFMTEDVWNRERKRLDYDYVIIGSSFCALGFATRALENNPEAKIMILERGAYYYPVHFQNLPPAFKETVGDPSETFPWNITKKTHEGKYIKWLHGTNFFFGGKSSFWSGWCPEPTDKEMRHWPDEVKKVVHDYFPEAKKLLNVTPANKICVRKHGLYPIYGVLQSDVQEKLKDLPSKIDEVTDVIPAPLAVGEQTYRNEGYQGYEKFSVQGPLLSLLCMSRKNQDAIVQKEDPPLKIMVNCLVKRIHHNDNGKAIKLETSRGDFELGNAKVILAMGTLPPTILMFNSYPMMNHIGERFTAHFTSSIIARVPFKIFPGHDKCENLEMGVVYVAGLNKESNHQFHIQLTIYGANSWGNSFNTLRQSSDAFAAPSKEQLSSSKDCIVFVCSVLGELDYDNSQNWFHKNRRGDVTSNVTLQVVANEIDNALWDNMEKSTFKMLDILAPEELEYWHSIKTNGETTGSWETGRPTAEMIRVSGLVHEASTMRIGKDKDSPVDLDYRFKGVENVYLTGASLWPTGGSWNPACTMSAMAMHLADQICPKVALKN